MAVFQSPRAYSSPTEVLLGISGECSSSPIPALSVAEWSTESSSKALLAGLVQAGLTDPVVEPLADIIVPLASRAQVGTVFAATQLMPMPIVWLAWFPVSEGRRQQ